MMMDIFSTFDPATNLTYKASPTLFWALFAASYSLLTSLWATHPLQSFITRPALIIMNTQSESTPATHLKGLFPVITALFYAIIIINLIGLLPYVFSLSSHIMFTLSLALPLWLSLLASSATWKATSFLANLLPSGAPGWLNWFLLHVEITSIMARPITLSFRLAANMSTGHIVLTLITSFLMATFLNHSSSAIILLLTSSAYTVFEMGICLLQAYIFCLLVTLYSTEHTT